MVPKEPINQGRLVTTYSRSVEWNRICYSKLVDFVPHAHGLKNTYACAVCEVAHERQNKEEE